MCDNFLLMLSDVYFLLLPLFAVSRLNGFFQHFESGTSCFLPFFTSIRKYPHSAEAFASFHFFIFQFYCVVVVFFIHFCCRKAFFIIIYFASYWLFFWLVKLFGFWYAELVYEFNINSDEIEGNNVYYCVRKLSKMTKSRKSQEK